MSITVCSINHKLTPIALREQVHFPIEKLPVYLSDLLSQESIQEAVILSTCNRSEIYCDTQDVNQIIQWYLRQHAIPAEVLLPHLCIYQDQAAVEHIMRVASGLDSMVLGETQILGQMKNAFSESSAAGTIGSLFNRLFQQVFAVAKEIRSNTAVGACPVSVASSAIALAKEAMSVWPKVKILLIGAGSTTQLVLRHLSTQGISELSVMNRSLQNAKELAEPFHAEAFDFQDLEKALISADVVISATASPTPIISRQLMERVQEKRKAAQVLIDIALPRDMEESISSLPGVSLYCIDDLKSRIQMNQLGRAHAAEKAEEQIRLRSQDFISWLHSYDAIGLTITAYRQQIEELCHLELIKARRQLERGEAADLVLSHFARALTNKLLHTPSVQLRRAGLEGRLDVLQLAQELFAIPQVGFEV